MKICSKCKEEKSKSEFHFSNKNKDRLGSQCKECGQIASRKYAKKRNYAQKLWREYALTEAQYELMLKLQNGVCAICGRPETKKQFGIVQKLCVDHKKKPFKVRNLLCFVCNRKLGVLEKDPDWTQKALTYLEKYK